MPNLQNCIFNPPSPPIPGINRIYLEQQIQVVVQEFQQQR